MRSALSLDLSFGHITLVHYRLTGPIGGLQNAWTWTRFSNFPGAIVPWTPRFVLPNEGISGPPAEPQWGSKLLELWFHKKTIKKLWIHKNVMLKNVDPQKKCEGWKLKLWIHKKSSWNFVDPQKYKTERFPVSSAKADVIESVFGTL